MKNNLEQKLCIFEIGVLNKIKRLKILQKLVYEKSYIHEIAVVSLAKIYFLKNAKKTRKPNNRDLNRD